jgi:hypothetical protein
LFNRTIEKIHSVAVLLAAKSMDSAECFQLQRSQQTLQHLAPHVQARSTALLISKQTRTSQELSRAYILLGIPAIRSGAECWLARQVCRLHQHTDRLHVSSQHLRSHLQQSREALQLHHRFNPC